METIRAFVNSRKRLAVLLIVLALVAKALVPAGFMPLSTGKVLMATICADASGGGQRVQQIALPANGKAASHGKSEGTCAYASLAMAALSTADAALLALALAFILALGFAPPPPTRPARLAFLRPPLRGPPLPA